MLLSLVFAATVSAVAPRVDALAVTDEQTAMRVNNGETSDEMWQLSNAVDAFAQRDPEEGGKPSQRTEFRVAYDLTTLYVKVRAFDSEASRIRGYLTRRDARSE